MTASEAIARGWELVVTRRVGNPLLDQRLLSFDKLAEEGYEMRPETRLSVQEGIWVYFLYKPKVLDKTTSTL